MSWSANASAILVQWRTQLLACPSIVAYPMVLAQFSYPDADFSDQTFPFAVLAETNHKRTRYAEGAIPLISFTLAATFYFDDTKDNGYLETFARTIIQELGAQYTGLAWREFETQLSSNLSTGQQAEGQNNAFAAYRTVGLTVQCGLSR